MAVWAAPAAGTTNIPDPGHCWWSSCLVLDLCGGETYTVYVRDFWGNVLMGSRVELDFKDAPGIVLDPASDPDGDGIVEGFTDQDGFARMHVRGGGVDAADVANVEVRADGISLTLAYPRAYDLNGNLAMDQGDLDLYGQIPYTSQAVDFDCNGEKNGVDLDLLTARVVQWGTTGSCTGTLGVEDGPGAAGLSVRCTPNPARSAVAFRIQSDVPAPARLAIYDVSGRRIRSFETAPIPPGGHSIAWDRRSDRGELVPAGTYFYRVQVGARATARRMVLLR